MRVFASSADSGHSVPEKRIALLVDNLASSLPSPVVFQALLTISSASTHSPHHNTEQLTQLTPLKTV